MSDNIKRIDIKEFRELGFLQEVNRCFLHPLGLALEVVQEDDGTEHLGGIWDYRDDPEGMTFADGVMRQEKSVHVEKLRQSKEEARMKLLGTVIQEL